MKLCCKKKENTSVEYKAGFSEHSSIIEEKGEKINITNAGIPVTVSDLQMLERCNPKLL